MPAALTVSRAAPAGGARVYAPAGQVCISAPLAHMPVCGHLLHDSHLSGCNCQSMTPVLCTAGGRAGGTGPGERSVPSQGARRRLLPHDSRRGHAPPHELMAGGGAIGPLLHTHVHVHRLLLRQAHHALAPRALEQQRQMRTALAPA